MELEYQRSIPFAGSWDVVVCGAGPSGIAAAVSAARQDMKVIILERYGTVGGNLTLGNVSPVMGGVAPGTIAEEIDRLIGSRDSGTAIDPERAKIELTKMLEREKVDFRLQTPVFDVVMEEKYILGVVASTQQGPAFFKGKRVIDCTGDGQIAFLSGASVMMGRQGDKRVQPMSLMYLIEGIDPDNTLECHHETDDTLLPDGRRYLSLCKEAAQDGRLPENVTIVRLYGTDKPGERMVNATQENGLNPLCGEDLMKAEISLRKQIETVNHFLQTEIPGFENIYTRVSASTMGIRESRRLDARYIIRDEDVSQGKIFPDVVVHHAGFCFDIHNPSGGGQAEEIEKSRSAKAHDIPMGSLLPSVIENLIVAGRCIGGTHRAHSSYRVMNICMAVGQAAGIMAAVSVKEGKSTGNLNVKDVQKVLMDAGCVLFDD